MGIRTGLLLLVLAGVSLGCATTDGGKGAHVSGIEDAGENTEAAAGDGQCWREFSHGGQ